MIRERETALFIIFKDKIAMSQIFGYGFAGYGFTGYGKLGH